MTDNPDTDPTGDDETALPSIDMTSQADQEFMDAEIEPPGFDEQAHYEQLLERYEANGWDTSRLRPPEPPDDENDDDEGVDKAAGFDYEACDDALIEAHEKLVQWNADKRLTEYDISKAPGVWESRDQVPEWVIETLKEMIRAGEAIWHGDYERLPPSADAVVERVLEDRLTQPQGWSLDSLLRDLKDHYPDAEDEYLLTILRNETSAVLNTAREQAYEAQEGSEDHVFDWIGPDDWRTTDTCHAIADEIEARGGAVPMAELKQILFEKALEHADAEGTPSRAGEWQPHWQCRRTFTRRVQSM